ncbi:hypothetical protein N7523_005557 [Penicillium sp. IBT 18751x]|nr:hypothetical protein N7523_005858 [Penicillium sp. IBT 18751x]KAJ6117806.1 hypothetical protein N7523_005557 [Penicillium sp. IBT 18751x]
MYQGSCEQRVGEQIEYLVLADTSIDQKSRFLFASAFTNPNNVDQIVRRDLRDSSLLNLAVKLKGKDYRLPVASTVEGVDNEEGAHILSVLLWVSQDHLDQIPPGHDTSMCFTLRTTSKNTLHGCCEGEQPTVYTTPEDELRGPEDEGEHNTMTLP